MQYSIAKFNRAQWDTFYHSGTVSDGARVGAYDDLPRAMRAFRRIAAASGFDPEYDIDERAWLVASGVAVEAMANTSATFYVLYQA